MRVWILMTVSLFECVCACVRDIAHNLISVHSMLIKLIASVCLIVDTEEFHNSFGLDTTK